MRCVWWQGDSFLTIVTPIDSKSNVIDEMFPVIGKLPCIPGILHLLCFPFEQEDSLPDQTQCHISCDWGSASVVSYVLNMNGDFVFGNICLRSIQTFS
jgi:hypothetical protein